MNLLERIFYKPAARAVRFIPQWIRSAFLPVDYQRLADGYQKNSAVAACVTALAFSFPEPPLQVGQVREGRFLPDYKHRLNAILRQPNPDMGWVELAQFAVTYASIGGNLYLWKQRDAAGRVVALWPFSDAQITPVPGEDSSEGFVREYELDPGDGQTVPLAKENVIQWKWMPDPRQPWRGIGAIEFAIYDVDKDSESSAYVYSLLKNNAVPPVVVTLAEGDELTQAKADRLRASWHEKLGGSNTGKVAFLEYGMKAEKMGFDMQQLAAEELNAVPESRIAAAFRVPPVVAGLSVGIKRSDYGDQAARRAFTELTLAALWRSFASELLNGLRADFSLPENYDLRFDLSTVRALQEEEIKRWERVTLAWNRGLITRAQAKEELGMAPDDGDDVFFISLASEFVPAGQVVRRDAGGVKAFTPGGGSSLLAAGLPGAGKKAAIGNILRRARALAARQFEPALRAHWQGLAARAEQRLRDMPKAARKGIDPDDLITPEDGEQMAELLRRYYLLVIELSWDAWNLALGVEAAFDLDDPIVRNMLALAGKRIPDIEKDMLDELRRVLDYAAANGWGIDQIVRGDPAAGIPALRDIITETYADRARFVARAELGQAQNFATALRYRDLGVNKVEVLDGGAEDSAPACDMANGQIWTLDLFQQYPLQHPNCSRAAAPYFGNEPARDTWAYDFGERG